MKADWSPLSRELAQMRREAFSLPLWWRDDDAISGTPALNRLLGLAETCGVPIALAVIPKHADATLVEACASHTSVTPLVHGWSHENHARPDAKKCEFPAGRAGGVEDAEAGLGRIKTLFGDDPAPVFVPPWNRIAPKLLPELARLGFAAVSTYGPRPDPFAAPGLAQINTHIDPIYWRGGGGLVQEDHLISQLAEQLRSRRLGTCDPSEPLGLLTHHLVHDTAIWDFTERFIETLLQGGATPVNIKCHVMGEA